MNAGLDLLRMAVDQWNQMEAEWAKEHPHATTTELHTSWSQPRLETLSVRSHRRLRLTTYLSLFHLRRCRGRLLYLRHTGPLPIEKVALTLRKQRKRLEELISLLHTNSEENDELPHHEHTGLLSPYPRTQDQLSRQMGH